MSSIGTGYDLSASTYSPDGRIFQIDYAAKATDNAPTAVAICCPAGVVLATTRPHNKLLVNCNSRIRSCDTHVGIIGVGLQADATCLAERLKDECAGYREQFHTPIPAKMAAKRIAAFIAAFTLYSSVRPFGVYAMLAAVDETGPHLYMVEPSGSCRVCFFRRSSSCEATRIHLIFICSYSLWWQLNSKENSMQFISF